MKNFKILLVNDDGVNAPGINILYRQLKVYLPEATIKVVAPLEERSTTGHTLSLNHPLRLTPVDVDHYGCSGFPADCTLMGIGGALAEIWDRPDLVVSGINRGGNLGQDIFYSGTVAGAREASFHKIPSIAISLVSEFSPSPPLDEDYLESGALLGQFIQAGLHRYLPEHHFFNVNVPNLRTPQIKGVKLTTTGLRHYSDKLQKMVDPRGRQYFWILGRYEGHLDDHLTDCVAIHDNFVSLTLMCPMEKKVDLSEKFHEELFEFNQKFFKLL